MANNNPSNWSIDRRKFMKTSAVGVIPVAYSAGVSAESKDEIVNLRGTEEDPISAKEIGESISKQRGLKSKINADTIPSNHSEDDKRFVAAYVEKIGANGVPITYIGYAYKNEDGAVKRIHNTADKVSQAMRQTDLAKEFSNPVSGYEGASIETSDEITTMDPDNGEYWNLAARITADAESNNGQVTLDGELYQFDLDKDGSSDSSVWSAVFTNRATPYNNNVQQQVDYFDITQDWEENSLWDVKDPGISQTEPSGNNDGSTSYTASLSAGSGGASAQVSWQYTQPNVSMEEETDQGGNENAAFWTYDPNNTPYDNPLQVITGSQCWIEEFESGTDCGIADTAVGTASATAGFNGWVGNDVTADLTMAVEVCSY